MCMLIIVFFFKQKTAYEMRISDWSSDVCSSDLLGDAVEREPLARFVALGRGGLHHLSALVAHLRCRHSSAGHCRRRRKSDFLGQEAHHCAEKQQDRNSAVQGKSVSLRVVLGGRRIIKKTQTRPTDQPSHLDARTPTATPPLLPSHT